MATLTLRCDKALGRVVTKGQGGHFPVEASRLFYFASGVGSD